MQAALAAFGLQAEALPTPAELALCEVWPQHQDALALFLACLGQLQLQVGMGAALWRAAPSPAVAQEARWLGIVGRQQAQVVQQYRVMEAEALDVLNQRELEAARKR